MRTTAPRRINFEKIASAALAHADTLVARWLPDGRREGAEWVARNPTRADHRPGSFKVNMRTGRWGDFSSGARGGDLVALAAYIRGEPMKTTALALAEMLGIDPYE